MQLQNSVETPQHWQSQSIHQVQEQIHIVSRSNIPGITEMTVEGVNTFLGEVRNFKNIPYLKEKLPKNLSISWTQMPKGKSLPSHFHPCSSVIVVAKGQGRSSGDTVAEIESGDVIYIPEWNSHGFDGLGEFGFHALSIQFQETAIFDSESTPETTYKQKQVPLKDRQLHIVSRKNLKSIHEVVVNGETKTLGTLKNFSDDSVLNKKFPDSLSMAWVHLTKGQTLDTHVHETDSMIIITQGSGYLIGDKNQRLSEGDLVYVPAGCQHGFIGGDEGFWGLSVQFEESSLYENPDQPQVEFISEFDRLVAKNEKFAQELLDNPVFNLSPLSLKSQGLKRKALLDGLQVMSNHFQRLMFARMALCDSAVYQPLFLEHFLEELGHDQGLAKERKSTETLWDPQLDAFTSWFVGKNYLIDNPGRIVMIQMVLEKGASLFYSHFAQILSDENSSEHINLHCEVDEGHDSMGVDLLKDESPRKLRELQELQSQSWDMLNSFLTRLSEMVEKA